MTSSTSLTVVGWLLVAAALYYWSKSKTGHTILYSVLSLILILLVLSNYKSIEGVVFKKSQAVTS